MPITIEGLQAVATNWNQIRITGRVLNAGDTPRVSIGGPQQAQATVNTDGSFTCDLSNVPTLAAFAVQADDRAGNYSQLYSVTPTCGDCVLTGLTATDAGNLGALVGGRLGLPFPPAAIPLQFDTGRLFASGGTPTVRREVVYNNDGSVAANQYSNCNALPAFVTFNFLDWFRRQYSWQVQVGAAAPVGPPNPLE